MCICDRTDVVETFGVIFWEDMLKLKLRKKDEMVR